MIRKIVVGITCCFSLVVQAQEFKTPQQVENRSEPVVAPENITNERAEVPVANADAVLMESLKGIWVHRSSNDTVNPVEPFTGLRVSAPSRLANTPVFRDMLNNYMNKPLTNGRLSHMVKEVLSYYRLLDYPFVDVFAPEQDITDGVLQLVIKEAKVGEIQVKGNEHFSDEYVGQAMRTNIGDLPHTPTIYEDANWLSENPFLRVQPVFGPGAEDGTTDIHLEVEDSLPLRVYSTYSNTGNGLIGKDQYVVGASYGNAFGLGHQISYQYTTGNRDSGLDAHALAYKVPLYQYRHNLLFNASSTRTGITQNALGIKGESDELSVKYQMPLEMSANGLKQDLEFGLELKRSNNALEFGFVPISDTTVVISQAVISYNGKLADSLGENSFNISLVRNLPGAFNYQSESDYQAVRAGADPDFTIVRLGYQRQTPLPMDMILVNNLKLQLADRNLISNEQLSVTGKSAVRGYASGQFNNIDNGLVLRNDLYLPAFSFWERDQWRPYLFLDYAYFNSKDSNLALPDGSVKSSESVSSLGLGMKVQVRDYLNLSAEWGHQLRNFKGMEDSYDFHVQATFQFY